MTDKMLGMLGLAVRAGKVQFGVYKTEEAILQKKARLVVAAQDMGASNLRSITAKCQHAGIPLIRYGQRDALGHALGKKDLPVVAVCDNHFAAAIVKLNGGNPND